MKCYHPLSVWHKEYKTAILVPCGKCPHCLARKRNELVMRMSLESEVSDLTLFLTLTFNDENLKLDENFDYIENFEDYSKFLAKLKRHYKDRFTIRYYGNTEHGELKGRPHAHFILFIKFLKYETNILSIIDDYCQTIDKFWGKGFISLRRATFGELWYTAKYTAKEHGESNSGVRQHRTFCSKHPFIGYEYVRRFGSTISYRRATQKKSVKDPRNFLYSKDFHYSNIPRTFKRYLRKKYNVPDKMTEYEWENLRNQQISDNMETLRNNYNQYLNNHCWITFDEYQKLYLNSKVENEKLYYYKRSKLNIDNDNQ